MTPPGRGGGVATATGATVEPVTLAWADEPETESIAYIAVRTRHDARLVTAIELLSPSNKEEPVRREFRAKMEALRRGGVNVVELDLLLGGRRLTMAGPLPAGDFYAYVGRADRRPNCDVFGWSIRHPLPRIPIPLRSPDVDVVLDLSAAFAAAFDNAEYDRSLPYGTPLAGPLSEADRAWAADCRPTS